MLETIMYICYNNKHIICFVQFLNYVLFYRDGGKSMQDEKEEIKFLLEKSKEARSWKDLRKLTHYSGYRINNLIVNNPEEGEEIFKNIEKNKMK